MHCLRVLLTLNVAVVVLGLATLRVGALWIASPVALLAAVFAVGARLVDAAGLCWVRSWSSAVMILAFVVVRG